MTDSGERNGENKHRYISISRHERCRIRVCNEDTEYYFEEVDGGDFADGQEEVMGRVDQRILFTS